MDTTEIMAELARARGLPDGRTRTQRLETLAAAAKQGVDRALEGRVLIDLAKAYTHAGERDLAPVTYARLLHIYDEYPAELGSLSHSVHWYLKWMTWGLIESPAVPLPVIRRWLDELDQRYRVKGYSPRPVLSLRATLARDLGEHVEAARLTRAAVAAPSDSMSDCDACERDDWGATAAAAGDDRTALDHWQPVLDGESTCAEQPHRIASRALLPLLRLGRSADARRAHLVGYPLVRHAEGLRDAVARHVEFCALTGNEARGLEILTEHAGWLTDSGTDAGLRLSFAGGVCVLLNRLSELGLGQSPLGTGTVASVRAGLGVELAELAARYDARNGHGVVGAAVAARLARRPLLDHLPLGIKVGLSEPLPARAADPVAGESERAAEAMALAEEAATHLLDDPALAEKQLRRALALGVRALPPEHLARLGSQLVMVMSGQSGREEELADAALHAAARWDGISDADATHLTFVAARAFHRAGRHGEAAALFEQPLAAGNTPYPDTEMAVLRSQYGRSLGLLGRHRDAARQFVEAAALVQHRPDRLPLRAELAASAATALDACGADDQARAAYLRAAELWGELDQIAARARCLRSAAWLQFWRDSATSDEQGALTTLRDLLAELEARDQTPEVAGELAQTRRQLANMESHEV
ncbi:hypothetical protein ACTD5D_32695 [Nocardia takedensis]|uniref:hypothetical protein n=1 Tax=Nocardia takedensis TaxID=259390 RepID=UPI00030FAA26|nr:hypothetical protein [Nocardia takedensis]